MWVFANIFYKNKKEYGAFKKNRIYLFKINIYIIVNL